MGRAQSLNAPLLPVAMYSSYETETLFRLFVQRPSRQFFLALSSSFYFSMSMPTQWEGPRHKDKDHHDNDMSTTPHHTQPPNQQRRATHDTAPHNKKQKNTHVHAHAHVSVCLYVHVGVHVHVGVTHFAHFSRKNAVWNTYLPWCVLFQAFDLPQWFNVPFLIQVQTWQTTQRENCKSKKK